MRDLAVEAGRKGAIPLAGGAPDRSFFPLESVRLKVKGGEEVEIGAEEMDIAQQYMLQNGGRGYTPLLDWAKDSVRRFHSPPSQAWECVITPGNSPALREVLDAVLDDGDTLLCGEYDFSASMNMLTQWTDGRGVRVEGIPFSQSEGMDPSYVEDLLSNWEREREGSRFPKAILVTPSSHNPCGISVSGEGILRMYAVARRFDLLVVEDDPYFFLDFRAGGILSLPPSFLSADTDGRVVRLDSFSKWMGPGLRCGWCTGPKTFVEKLLQNGVPSMGSSSFSQVCVASLLSKWGEEGLQSHLSSLQSSCARRARIACDSLSALGDKVSFLPPVGGMFVWVRLKGVEDSHLLFPSLVEAGVAVVPGSLFRFDRHASPYVRIAFCACDEEMTKRGIAAMGSVLEAME